MSNLGAQIVKHNVDEGERLFAIVLSHFAIKTTKAFKWLLVFVMRSIFKSTNRIKPNLNANNIISVKIAELA